LPNKGKFDKINKHFLLGRMKLGTHESNLNKLNILINQQRWCKRKIGDGIDFLLFNLTPTPSSLEKKTFYYVSLDCTHG